MNLKVWFTWYLFMALVLCIGAYEIINGENLYVGISLFSIGGFMSGSLSIWAYWESKFLKEKMEVRNKHGRK